MKPKAPSKTARNTLLTGAALFVIAIATNLITIATLYASTNKCSEKASACTFHTQQSAVKFSVALIYIAIAVTVVGCVMLALEHKKRTDKPSQ